MKEKKEKSNKNESQVSFFGIGPIMTLYSLPFIIIFSILNAFFYSIFQIPIHYIWLLLIGILLTIIGLYIYIKSVKVVKNAYNSSRLTIEGFYGHMRHPMYGAVILFILPGIVFLLNSWILFFIPLTFYIMFRIFIKREEIYCLEKFGEKYSHYKHKVYAILPKLKKYQSIKK